MEQWEAALTVSLLLMVILGVGIYYELQRKSKKDTVITDLILLFALQISIAIVAKNNIDQ